MLKKLIHQFLFVGLLGFVTGSRVLWAQTADFQEVLKKVTEAYSRLTVFQTNIFVSVEGAKGKQTFSATMKKNGKSYFYSIGQTTFLMNERYVLSVSDQSKMIVVKKHQGRDNWQDFMTQLTGQQLDSIVKSGTVEKHSPLNYTVTKKDAAIEKTEFYLSPSYLFEKLVYTYSPKHFPNQRRATVVFQGTETQPVFAPLTFSESQFVRPKGSGFEGVGKYYSYTVKIVSNY